jgi:hypothetical protein
MNDICTNPTLSSRSNSQVKIPFSLTLEPINVNLPSSTQSLSLSPFVSLPHAAFQTGNGNLVVHSLPQTNLPAQVYHSTKPEIDSLMKQDLILQHKKIQLMNPLLQQRVPHVIPNPFLSVILQQEAFERAKANLTVMYHPTKLGN